ncbi:MAG TPA: methylenetetrahydrofolate--tRNA-(uracil(54)-C(5))-methyltransferase (FADH(2)-oxidizing) TrmFO [Syntrophomonadaceae bacterium]|nr:methylenetetrahydrofolate--tRNA-(uracil(54)-C(5))-methyltransferase (FADH(2)-oxidizing) TrmFO [Syntrophomonadaceae bacterium]
MDAIHVIGGGLAGCEAAYQIAAQSIPVKLWEMRPGQSTPAHQTGDLAELVCSNSLKSEAENTAQGLLKMEMRTLGSLLIDCAQESRVPAGSALAVDRRRFSRIVSQFIESNPFIQVVREEILELPASGLCIIATGPLTSSTFSACLQKLNGEENLHFYDAIAPSVTAESLDYSRIFKASRYGKGSADYLNSPFSKEEYELFYKELVEADIREGHAIDQGPFFNACMPVEVMAQRGVDTMRFGPMRPVGLEAGEGEDRPYAVVQLRQEDLEGRIFGLVGFQTRLRWGEQDRVFRLIPGLEKAEFVRYGSMHRNTFMNSPALLHPTLQWNKDNRVIFAGQLTGVEGYMESAATGILAGINAARLYKGMDALTLPATTMIGALVHFITSARDHHFQPVNANFGLLPPLQGKIRDKQKRYQAYVDRSRLDMGEFSELL